MSLLNAMIKIITPACHKAPYFISPRLITKNLDSFYLKSSGWNWRKQIFDVGGDEKWKRMKTWGQDYFSSEEHQIKKRFCFIAMKNNYVFFRSFLFALFDLLFILNCFYRAFSCFFLVADFHLNVFLGLMEEICAERWKALVW